MARILAYENQQIIVEEPATLPVDLHSLVKTFFIEEKKQDHLSFYRFSAYQVLNAIFQGKNIFDLWQQVCTQIEGRVSTDYLQQLSQLLELYQQKPLQKASGLKQIKSLPDTSELPPLRSGQKQALEAIKNYSYRSALIQLPSGYGKTRLGLEIIRHFQSPTIILCPHEAALLRWQEEFKNLNHRVTQLKNWENFKDDRIYIAQASLLRKQVPDASKHCLLLIDEVHALDTKQLFLGKFARQIGMSATLKSQGGDGTVFFENMGPCVYQHEDTEQQVKDIQWFELIVPMQRSLKTQYLLAKGAMQRQRLAAENPGKSSLVSLILRKHPQARFIIFSQYLSTLKELSTHLNLPYIDSKSGVRHRRDIYRQFNQKVIPGFLSSSVSNESIDLPEANLIIQLSGGHSDEEESQRLGRLLRKKEHEVCFYSLLSEGTTEVGESIERKKYLPMEHIQIKRIKPENLLE